MASQSETVDHFEEDNEGSENEVSAKRTKRTSKVWDEMKKIRTVDGLKVQCIHCGKILAGSGGTSHLMRHLRTCPKRPLQPETDQHRLMEGTSSESFKFIKMLLVKLFCNFLCVESMLFLW